MARSVHTTRREVTEARAWDYADARRQHDDIWVAQEGLRQKRSYKTRTLATRAALDRPLNLLGSQVDVTVEHGSPYIHHPLTIDDVASLLACIPVDTRPELRMVHLRSGLHENDMHADGAEPDPFTGRPGFDIGGGIFLPPLLGRYRFEPCEIDLFGFVYDQTALKVPEVQLSLIWLQQAATLAHEVAHCWDHRARTRGDRWGIDDKVRAEEHAQHFADRWLLEVAVPYFHERYPDRWNRFEAWTAQHIGIPITVARPAEDVGRALWGVDEGLLSVCAQWDGANEADLRVEVAEHFHFVDDYEPAKRILDTVLGAHPRHAAATQLMADIAVHERDWDKALEWSAAALELKPEDLESRKDRVDALAGAQRWDAAVKECDEALQLKGNRNLLRTLKLDRIWCLVEAKDYAAANKSLEELLSDPGLPSMPRQRAGALKAETLMRQEHWAAAREFAIGALVETRHPVARAFLTAAAWEAATRLGDASATPVPTGRQLELLGINGRKPWADRLIALGLEPAEERLTRRSAALARSHGPRIRV